MRRSYRAAGCCLCAAGLVILLAMVLPSGFWWFLLGAVLICGGIALCRRC